MLKLLGLNILCFLIIYRMPCIVTVGGFYGDEGKGKIVAYLSMKDN